MQDDFSIALVILAFADASPFGGK